MKFGQFTISGLAVALVCCGPEREPQQAANDAEAPVLPEPGAPPTATISVPPKPGTAGGLPDDRTPLEEPKGAIDPKSAEAAGQVVQHYGALIEQKKWNEAAQLWGDAGAAGSSYITVPIVLYGKQSSGSSFHRSGDVILRRVNDEPGSTEAQRRWHIERIDWGKA
jgi:hypothetical protein